MQSRQILDAHPSVQDLVVAQGRINMSKVQRHRAAINAGPLTSSNTYGKNVAKWEKGARIESVRNEAAIVDGRMRLRTPAVEPSIPVAKSSSLPPLAPKSTDPTASATTDQQPVSLSQLKGASLGSRRDKPASIVSSVVSFDADRSHAESYSVYTCSCCGVKPPSSVLSAATSSRPASSLGGGSRQPRHSGAATGSECFTTTEDQFTSVSQRKPNGSRHSSVNSVMVRTLEGELAKEREDRVKTEEELQRIKQRQELLLSKLSDTERQQFEKLLAGAK